MAEQVLMHKKYYMPYQIGFLSDDDETFRIYFDKKSALSRKKKRILNIIVCRKASDGRISILFFKEIRNLDRLLPYIAGSRPWLNRR